MSSSDDKLDWRNTKNPQEDKNKPDLWENDIELAQDSMPHEKQQYLALLAVINDVRQRLNNYIEWTESIRKNVKSIQSLTIKARQEMFYLETRGYQQKPIVSPHITSNK